MLRPLRALWLWLMFTALLFGCGSREGLGDTSLRVLGAGVVNDPANKSLRFDLLKFGLDRFCGEMTRRGVPLRLSDAEPVLGRFFAESCQSQVLDEGERKSFVVQYTGKGYAWTNVTGKLGFTARGLVEYAPDFQMSDGALYVYFRPKTVDAAAFQLLSVDSAVAQAGLAILAGSTNPDEIGRQVLLAELSRGFTVIRYGNDGRTDFGLGFVPKGEAPYKPFQIQTRKSILSNERTEVHAQSQDFIGPLEVSDRGRSLFFTFEIDGAESVDVLLLQKSAGDAMLDRYVKNAGPSPQIGAPIFEATVRSAGRAQPSLALPAGEYYLLLDNSAAAGHSAPPPGNAADNAVRVDYAVLLGDSD